jgi:hypothetical protein
LNPNTEIISASIIAKAYFVIYSLQKFPPSPPATPARSSNEQESKKRMSQVGSGTQGAGMFCLLYAKSLVFKKKIPNTAPKSFANTAT